MSEKFFRSAVCRPSEHEKIKAADGQQLVLMAQRPCACSRMVCSAGIRSYRGLAPYIHSSADERFCMVVHCRACLPLKPCGLCLRQVLPQALL